MGRASVCGPKPSRTARCPGRRRGKRHQRPGRWRRTAARRCSGPGVAGSRRWASRRMTAWKWTTPRAWYSATLTYRMRSARAESLGDAREAGELAGQVGGEPAPQVTGAGVEQHRGLVVVAVAAHRPAEPGIVFDVAGRAGDVAAVRAAAGLGVAAGSAGQDGLAAHPPGVDRPERGGGEGREHARMSGDRFGDAFAAGQTGADELAGVALVDRRAGRADRLAAVAARDVQHSPGLGRSVVDGGGLAGGAVDGLDVAVQTDGVRAGARVASWRSQVRKSPQATVSVVSSASAPAPEPDRFGGESGCRGRVGHWLPQRCWAAWRVMPSRGRFGPGVAPLAQALDGLGRWRCRSRRRDRACRPGRRCRLRRCGGCRRAERGGRTRRTRRSRQVAAAAWVSTVP